MTAARSQLDQPDLAKANRIVSAVAGAFSAKVVGQQHLRESMLIGLLAGGHLLVESVRGLAKTTAARGAAESVCGASKHVQCTPDLLPSDIIGTQIYEAATNSFVTRLGPVHANIVLLDEVNSRAPKPRARRWRRPSRNWVATHQRRQLLIFVVSATSSSRRTLLDGAAARLTDKIGVVSAPTPPPPAPQSSPYGSAPTDPDRQLRLNPGVGDPLERLQQILRDAATGQNGG